VIITDYHMKNNISTAYAISTKQESSSKSEQECCRLPL
jgi:hypothetical protein